MPTTLLFIPSGGEILLIFLVVLILFGADNIPGFARTIGKGMREFRRATEDIKRELETSGAELKEEFKQHTNTIIEDIKHQEAESTISENNLPTGDPYADNDDTPIKPNRTFINEDTPITSTSAPESEEPHQQQEKEI